MEDGWIDRILTIFHNASFIGNVLQYIINNKCKNSKTDQRDQVGLPI